MSPDIARVKVVAHGEVQAECGDSNRLGIPIDTEETVSQELPQNASIELPFRVCLLPMTDKPPVSFYKKYARAARGIEYSDVSPLSLPGE